MSEAGSLALGVPPELLDVVADRVARAVVERMPDPPEPYMTVDQAAEYLACANRRIYDMVGDGRLVPYRDGKRLLFKREDLDAALTHHGPE